MLVLDTSALSRAMRQDPLARAHAEAQRPGELFLVPPVAAEIQYGIARLPAHSRRSHLLRTEYRRWRTLLRWLEWGEDASAIFGEQKARLEVRGVQIGDMDLAVAAIALANGLGVATCNVRHFSRIEGLQVHDWAKTV